MLPSCADLDYFLEVSSTLNISRASERLGISQSSLSHAIKRLETCIGCALFIRHKNGVTLTQSGKQLLVHTRQLIAYWEQTRSNTLASIQEIRGIYSIGCNQIIARYLLSDVLVNLLETYSELEIQLKHDISRKITEKVIDLTLHLGIVVNPVKHPDLIMVKLFEDIFTCWVAANKKKTPSVLICEPSLHQTEYLIKQCKDQGIQSERIITTDSLEVAADLTAKGGGIGILPSHYVNRFYQKELVRIENAPVFSDEVFLIYRPENRDIQAMKTMIDHICHAARQINAPVQY